MQLENVINRLLKFINTRLQALSMTVTSGSVDSMENYKYIIGQINGLEATKQELSNLLEDKEQNGKGTGKKPKGSGRRLYTDENPKDTVGIKFATPADARKTVAKVKKISKPFARKIQILTVGEQRAKVMGKSKVAAIFKKAKDAIRRTNNNK